MGGAEWTGAQRLDRDSGGYGYRSAPMPSLCQRLSVGDVTQTGEIQVAGASPERRTLARSAMRFRCPTCVTETADCQCPSCGLDFDWNDALLSVAEARAAAVALGHPTRRAIIGALRELGEGSPRELARVIGVPLNHATYHVKVLASGMEPAAVVKVRTKQVRGARQGFYRLTEGWAGRKG